MPEKTLIEFVTTFDRASLQPLLKEAEEQRRMILGKFPRESLGQVEMKDYACDGEDRSTLASLLMRGSPALGGPSGGVAFNAVGIHRLKGTGLYRSTLKDAGDAESDWFKLREGLVKCCDLVFQGQWEAINRVSHALNIPSLRTKLLYIYFHNEVLPIYTSTEVAHFMEALGVSMATGEGKWSATHNRRLLEHLRSLPELQGWSTLELTELLRAWFPMRKSKPSNMNQLELVLAAMHAMLADDPVENECVAPDQVREYVKMNFGRDIAACGTVMADMVAPGITQTKTSKVPLHLRVLERVRQGLYRLLPDAAETSPDHETLDSQTPPPMSTPALNQILYGPPGTGKTYRVIREAAAIIAGQPLVDDQEAKAAYDRACAEGRARLATFHQSFSYEDFIEGIRPVMEETGVARFEVRDGIFKEIASDALFACLERVPKAFADDGFEFRWSALIQEIDATGELEIPGLSETRWKLIKTKKGNLEIVNSKTGKEFLCSRSVLTKIWNKLSPQPSINSSESQMAYGKPGHHHVIAAVYNYMQTLRPLGQSATQGTLSLPELPTVEPDKAETVLTYLELGPASGWQLRVDKAFPPYVLIIDEINRGNISRIFGELITLIEDDKREGEANAMRVTLPSSREPFTVPPNLYLLGTMNTADKSLALLDVALRRRFEFRELAPDFTACKDLPVEMRAVLKRLNERIELRKDRDHRIGHAFFMGVKDAAGFNRAFVRKVVPLLQEYFFNDIDGARFVLGEIGREGEVGFLRKITAASADAKYQRNRWRWFTDVEPDMDCWARLWETLTV